MFRSFIITAASTLALTLAGTAIAADEKMSQEKATPTVQIDDNHLRVTEWRFAPGAATGFHRHQHDYVVVPMRDGELKIIGPKGEVSYAKLQLGKSRFRNAGVEHDVINNGPGEMVFIEIELKDTVIGRE
jgi:quercetin dioxygenase-like cupin family protein